MYDTLPAAIALLDTYTRRIGDLQAMVPATQGGAVASITVVGLPNAVPLPTSLVVSGLNSEIARLTALALALKTKLDAAAVVIG